MFFEVPVAEIVRRRHARGDWHAYEERALEYGFATQADRLRAQYADLPIMRRLCAQLEVSSATLRFSCSGTVDVTESVIAGNRPGIESRDVREVVEDLTSVVTGGC